MKWHSTSDVTTEAEVTTYSFLQTHVTEMTVDFTVALKHQTKCVPVNQYTQKSVVCPALSSIHYGILYVYTTELIYKKL